MISSKKISQLSLPNEIFNLLLQVIALIRVMSVISMEVAILILIAHVGISLHLLWPLQGWFILDLHKHLKEEHSRAYNANSVIKTNLPSCCLYPSSLLSGPSLNGDLVQDGVGALLLSTLLSSSSW